MKKKNSIKESLKNISTFTKKIWEDVVSFTKKNWKDIAIFAICLTISIYLGYNLEKGLHSSKMIYACRLAYTIFTATLFCLLISLILYGILCKINEKISEIFLNIPASFILILAITFVALIILNLIQAFG